jgi:hypothetical protein
MAAQRAVTNQGADDLAMRTGRLLKPFHHHPPFVVVAEKPSLLPHRTSPKIAILPGWCGVKAGYDLFILERGAG